MRLGTSPPTARRATSATWRLRIFPHRRESTLRRREQARRPGEWPRVPSSERRRRGGSGRDAVRHHDRGCDEGDREGSDRVGAAFFACSFCLTRGVRFVDAVSAVRQGGERRLLLPERAKVQDEVRDAWLQRKGEPRRRRHVADRLRTEGGDHRRGGKDRRWESNTGPAMSQESAGASRRAVSAEKSGICGESEESASAWESAGESRACSNVANGPTAAELIDLVDTPRSSRLKPARARSPGRSCSRSRRRSGRQVAVAGEMACDRRPDVVQRPGRVGAGSVGRAAAEGR